MRDRDGTDPDSKDVLPRDDEAERPAAGTEDRESNAGRARDADLVVSTGLAANVGRTSATLEGSLDDLDGAGVAVGFEYREAGTDEWIPAPARTRSAPGTFDRVVRDLSPGTDYEFRATARGGGDVATGSVGSFTTAPEGSVPVVDWFEVTEAGLPNPHAELSAKWRVSAPGEDLSTVLVRVVDADGCVVDATRTDASDDDAYGVDHFRIEEGLGEPLEVKLTVTDVDGFTTTETRPVTARPR